MLSFKNLALRRGPRVLFEQVNGALFAGERVALVGANGSGKSSLLTMIRGQLGADSGEISIQGGKRLAYVAQEFAQTDQTTVDFVLDGDDTLRALEQAIRQAEQAQEGERLGWLHAEYDSIGGYAARSRAARLLAGLGFDASDIERPMNTFSGGWQRRMALARALMGRADILLLDEPTNHLDLDAILWLEQWLLQFQGLLLVIAHDRDFLDRLATQVIAIEQQRITFYRGNYSAYETKRASLLAQQQANFARTQAQAERIKAFVERFKAKASKARQAQSRLKALARLPEILPAHADTPFEFAFLTPRKLPQPLLQLNQVSVGYGTRVIVADVGLSLSPGSRIGLLGRNGAGKSTLMRVLAGVTAPLAGERIVAADLVQGYFEQHQLERLTDSESCLWHLTHRSDAPIARASELERRNFLAGFGFTGDRVFEPVGPFSGGERARLVLALLVAKSPNLLLLDEPTNHLDLEMREALNLALLEYPGAIVLVSHDRHLLRSICDELWWVKDGRVQPYQGSLEDYATQLPKTATPPVASVNPSPANAPDPKTRRRLAAQARQQLAPLRLKVRRFEQQVMDLETQAARIKLLLEDPMLYAPEQKPQLQQLTLEAHSLKQAIQEAETAWSQAVDALQAVELEDKNQ
jgi:ATP-binding cassette, subfamily F, member 3